MATKKKPNISKKQSTSSGQPRSYSDLYKGDTTRTVPAVGTTLRNVVVAKEPATTPALNWREEYTYVASDLTQLGIVSAVLFGVIIVSGFFF